MEQQSGSQRLAMRISGEDSAENSGLSGGIPHAGAVLEILKKTVRVSDRTLQGTYVMMLSLIHI